MVMRAMRNLNPGLVGPGFFLRRLPGMYIKIGHRVFVTGVGLPGLHWSKLPTIDILTKTCHSPTFAPLRSNRRWPGCSGR
jgi:hypothetical protein